MLRGLVILAAFGAAVSAGAAEQLFIGQVQQIVLRPSGVNGCPKPCPDEPPSANGARRVCISTVGGCQATELQVREVFLGDLQPGSTTTVDSRPGEFQVTVFPPTSEPVLVSLNDGAYRWAEIKTRDGKVFFKPGRIWKIGGIEPKSLPADADGMVSLDELLARVRAAR